MLVATWSQRDSRSCEKSTVAAIYDRIGLGYERVRRPDPRLAELITESLGDAETVLNVGAGAG